MLAKLFARQPKAELRPSDVAFLSPVNGAQVLEPAPAATHTLPSRTWIMLHTSSSTKPSAVV